MGLIAQLKRSSLVHALFAISYFTSGLIINVVQFILVLFVKPIDRTLFRKLMYYVNYSFYCRKFFLFLHM